VVVLGWGGVLVVFGVWWGGFCVWVGVGGGGVWWVGVFGVFWVGGVVGCVCELLTSFRWGGGGKKRGRHWNL